MTRPTDAGTRRHRRRRAVAALAICGAAALATTSPAWADPPTNSSFENPALATGGSQTIAAGDPALTGWTVASGNIALWNRPDLSPPDGNQYIDLTGTASGIIQQSFPTTAGVGYTISWSFGALTGAQCPATPRTATFSVQGSAIIPMSVTANSQTDPNWQVGSTTFTGTGNPVLLQFNNTTPAASCGLALDNVAIAEDASVPVVDPEVAASLLAVTGLGVGVWFVMRRRRVSGPLAV